MLLIAAAGLLPIFLLAMGERAGAVAEAAIIVAAAGVLRLAAAAEFLLLMTAAAVLLISGAARTSLLIAAVGRAGARRKRGDEFGCLEIRRVM